MAATLDQILSAVSIANRKLDTLISGMGAIMALQDDLVAAQQLLNEESASLADSYDKLAALLDQMRQAQVDPAIVAAFETTLAAHKTSVDKIATLANPAPAP